VIENKTLTSPEAPSKIHLEFKLPEGQSYRAGDYLAMYFVFLGPRPWLTTNRLPHNPSRDVHRVLAHFGLTEDHRVSIVLDSCACLSPTSRRLSFHPMVRLRCPSESLSLCSKS
jgi:cytochrome P450/NADPH-cytochrome P450 reductase